MSVLVTGGAGYIGSHTVRELLRRNRRVVILDSLVRGNRNTIPSEVPLEVVDICDSAAVTDVCRRHDVDCVVHFAAYKSAGESMEKPGLYWRNNVHGTAQLVEGILNAGVRKLVFSSSAAVYGNPEKLPIDESAAIRPENVYAETKAIMERLIGWYTTTHDLCWVSLRYFNAAGASSDGSLGEDWSITTNLVPLVMKAALGASGPVRILGNDYPTPDGTGVRDYIHVEDLATAHVAAIDHLEGGGSNATLNLGTGQGHSVLEVLKAVEAVSGRPVPHEIVGRRPGDPATVYADVRLAESTLGWKATRDLDEIVGSAFRWHSSQR